MIKIKTRIILSKYAHREFCSSGGLLSWAYYDISCLNSCRHHLSQFYETTQKYQLVCPTTVHSASNFLNHENFLKKLWIRFWRVFCIIKFVKIQFHKIFPLFFSFFKHIAAHTHSGGAYVRKNEYRYTWFTNISCFQLELYCNYAITNNFFKQLTPKK